MKRTARTQAKSTDFKKLFTQIAPEKLDDNVFILAGKVFPVITAGTKNHYNAMTGSGGGFGVLFKKPATWCILRSDRYTLELMQKEHTYTMSYFPARYRKEVVFLGSKSGRDSDKMKEVGLTAIQTPSGNMSFEEARLIIECKLTQLTTPDLADFCDPKARDYVKGEYKTASHYRKFVFGEITHAWINK
jgi:flavin reductase (DIM6/NTAB) family NADH-FMN oxidoreductase RutF